MMRLVGMAGRGATSRNRGNVWVVLLALLLGGVMAAAPPQPLTVPGRTVLVDASAGWGGYATLPDPLAQNRSSPDSAAVPSSRGKLSSSPWPQPGSDALAVAFSLQLDGCRAPACRPLPAAVRVPSGRRLAYDSHGPPFFAG